MSGAVLIGLCGGVGCYLCVTKVKAMFGYDDSLDVFGVHCCGSVIGMLMLGFLANAEVNPAIANTFKKNGQIVSLAGSSGQFLNQAIAVIFTAVFSVIVTWVLLKVISATIGLRVEAEEEHSGLDVSEHGESAYNE